MAAKPTTFTTLDGKPTEQGQPFIPERSTFIVDTERAQSGGLDDDPTDSGAPVKNRTSFKNLTGGR